MNTPMSIKSVAVAICLVGSVIVLTPVCSDEISYDYDTHGRLKTVYYKDGYTVTQIDYAYGYTANSSSKIKTSYIQDSDGDGLADGEEDINGNGAVDSGETDPTEYDTDGDMLPDGYEVDTGFNPLLHDSYFDYDGDGYSNLREFFSGTDATNRLDLPVCIANLDLTDKDVDGIEVYEISRHLGAIDFALEGVCHFDVDDDGDVDSIDLFLFSEEFGRQDCQ